VQPLAKAKAATAAQTTSILVGGSVALAMWIVVIASIHSASQTANLQRMIVLLCSIATVLLCGLLGESHRRAQRELDLATKQEKLEATNLQLEESRRRAEQASAAKSLFLANMSHELKTPLNAIIGFSEIIKKQAVNSSALNSCCEYAEDIISSGHHLFELIGNILDISKIEAGGINLDEEAIEVAVLIKGAITSVTQAARQKHITIEALGLEEAPLIRGDQPRLRQVLLNLLSNAIKFTPDAGAVVVQVEPTRNGELVIAVSDTGIGMSSHEIAIALQPFGQVDNGLAKAYAGAGIGLPLAKRLMELHGGNLVVESAKNAGTTIRVYLPSDRVAAERGLINGGPLSHTKILSAELSS
jgi:two-component system, cell cycle sensor histidine kinase PleC